MHMAAAALLLGAATQATARSISEIKQSGKIIIGGSSDAYEPFFYTKNGATTGWEYELGNALAKNLGVTPVWKTDSFSGLPARLKNGEYDIVISSLALTESRKKLVDFTNTPEYCSGRAFLSTTKRRFEQGDLKGKVVAVMADTSQAQDAAADKRIDQLQSFTTDEDALQSVVFGRSDLLITDSVVAETLLKRYPKLAYMSKPYDLSGAYIAVPKNSQNLKTAVDNSLKTLMSNGEYEKITSHYFSRSIKCPAGAK